MSSFDQFSTNNKSSSITALLDTFQETLGLGMKKMSQDLSRVFGSPGSKHQEQISIELENWEQERKKIASPL